MMLLSRMRYIDDTVGMFICNVLGQIIRLKNIFLRRTRDIPYDKVRVIVCQKYFGMGSILHSIPLIRALRVRYPNARIIFLTLESQREVVELCGIADEVLTIRLDSFGVLIKDALTRIFYLLRQGVDISVDLEFFSKFTLLVSLLTMARIRIGLYKNKIRPEGVITHEIYYNPYKHISEIYFAYALSLGIMRRPEYFAAPLPSLKYTLSKPLFNKFALNHSSPLVIVNVNSSNLFKFRCWPADYFVRLLKLFINDYPNCHYILVGDDKDTDYVEAICRKVERPSQLINLAGKTSIRELFALIEIADLVITNDSGPLHIASLYQKNLVVFFGPETPLVYGPLNENSLVFYSSDLYCSPCLSVYDSKKALFGENCLINTCLVSIQPEDVYERIKQRFLKQLALIPAHKGQ